MNALILLAALVACAAGVPLNTTRPRLDGRTVGGSTTTIDKHPHQVSLHYSGSHICSGSIISSNWVVTAAHCIIGSSVSPFSVRAGSTYSNYGGTIHSATKIIVHGSYNDNTQDYDVALVQVSPALTYSTSVKPIALESSTVAVGTNAVVTGWGTTSEGGSDSNALREVTVQIVSDSSCSSSYSAYGGITARMICAGTPSGGKYECLDDSGAPLVANSRLVGIVSWGVGCSRSKYPGIYTKVSAVRSWIVNNAT